MFPHILIAVVVIVVAALLFFLYRLYANTSALASKVCDLAASIDHAKTLIVDSAEIELIVRQEINKTPRAPHSDKKHGSLTVPGVSDAAASSAGKPAAASSAGKPATASSVGKPATATSVRKPVVSPAIPRRFDEKPLEARAPIRETKVVPVNRVPRVVPELVPVDEPRVGLAQPDAATQSTKETAEEEIPASSVERKSEPVADADETLDSVFGEDINKIFAIAQISGIEFNFDVMSRDDQEDPRTRSSISTMFMAAQAAETFFADLQGAGAEANPGVVIQEIKD